jgi:hypothetical protein
MGPVQDSPTVLAASSKTTSGCASLAVVLVAVVSNLEALAEMDTGLNISQKHLILSVSSWARSPQREAQVMMIWCLPSTHSDEPFVDIFCYQCSDTKLDPDFALHLSSFGINIAMQTKTEKSVTELVSSCDLSKWRNITSLGSVAN